LRRCGAPGGGRRAGCLRSNGRRIRVGSTRAVDELYSAWLAVPPGVEAGERLTPSASLEGMLRPVSFRVRLDEA
jgi:hypothetical protein